MMPIEETGKTKEQMQRDYAEKQHKVTSQQERLSNPILWAFWLYSAVAAGFIANQIWSGPFQHFGGTIFRVIMIVIFAVVGLIAAVIAYFFVGIFNASLDQGFVKGRQAAVISLLGVAIGAAIGAVKGASINVPSGLLIGLWIGLYVSGAIMAIVATIIFKVTQRGVAEASPWYVKASDRVVILRSEVVDLPPKVSPPKVSPPKVSPPKVSPPQTSASTPQEAPQGERGNPLSQGIEVGQVVAVNQGLEVVRATRTFETQKFTHTPVTDYVITFKIVNHHEMNVHQEVTPYGTNMKLILDGKKIKPSRPDKGGGGYAYGWSFKIDGTNCSFTASANYGPGYGAPIIRDTAYHLVRLSANGKVCWEHRE